MQENSTEEVKGVPFDDQTNAEEVEESEGLRASWVFCRRNSERLRRQRGDGTVYMKWV